GQAHGLARGGLVADVLHRLVLAQALEAGLPQQALLAETAELEFRHQFRLHPGHVARPERYVRRQKHRGLAPRQRLQALEHRAQGGVVEAGADPADVLQRAVLAGRHQQRTERGARALRRGEAHDHELVRLRVLGLDPAPGAAGDVAGPDALADDALHALLAAGGEDLRAVPDDVLAVAEHGRR